MQIIKQPMLTERGYKLEPELFNPIKNAKQTVEVFSQNGKIKMQIRRKEFTADEIIQSSIKKGGFCLEGNQ